MSEDDDRAALDYQAQLEERRRRQACWDQWALCSKKQMRDEIDREHDEFEKRQRRLEEWLRQA